MSFVHRDNQVRLGRVKVVGKLGRIALEVGETGDSKRVVSFADPLDVDRFNQGDVVTFDYDDRGSAINVEKSSKKNRLSPSSFKHRL